MYRLFVGQADPFHGSTALETLFMSTERVATFCKYTTWQCELNSGRLFNRSGAADEQELASLLWTADLHDVFVKWAHPPLRAPLLGLLASKGIVPKVYAINMFRPPCLYPLSSHSVRLRRENATQWAAHEGAVLRASFARMPHCALSLNYGDLLWRFEKVQHAFYDLFGLYVRNDYVLTLHRDVYPYNELKVHGSLQTYAQSHRPSSYGYNVTTANCTRDVDLFPIDVLDALAALTSESNELVQ